MTRWETECAEWQAILAEMIGSGKQPSAYQVTLEQRKRMLARGDRPMTMEQVQAESMERGQ